MKLDVCRPGDHVRLLDFGLTPPNYRRRLLMLGITPGTTLQVIRFAPLGCPIEVRVRETFLSLRQDETQHLNWEKS